MLNAFNLIRYTNTLWNTFRKTYKSLAEWEERIWRYFFLQGHNLMRIWSIQWSFHTKYDIFGLLGYRYLIYFMEEYKLDVTSLFCVLSLWAWIIDNYFEVENFYAFYVYYCLFIVHQTHLLSFSTVKSLLGWLLITVYDYACGVLNFLMTLKYIF